MSDAFIMNILFEPTDLPIQKAQRLYLSFYDQIAQWRNGDTGLDILKAHILENPEFAEIAELMLHEVVPAGNHWVDATIRVLCKRVLHAKAEREQVDRDQILSSNANYGRF